MRRGGQNPSEVVREALRRYEGGLAAVKAYAALVEGVAQQGMATIDKGDFTADKRHGRIEGSS